MTLDRDSRIFVVVPARGGSRGVHRKNLALVAGRPLLAWTIEAVDSAATRMRCIVSTEDADIAHEALGWGAEVVARPASLADDTSPTEPSVIHALDAVGAQPCDIIVLLQVTSPVRLPGTLDRALQTYAAGGANSLVGVVPVQPFLWLGPAASPRAVYNVNARKRRQDFTPTDLAYRETGSLYITRVGDLRTSGNRISGHVKLFVMDPIEGVDIDTPAQLAAAEAVLLGSGASHPWRE